MKKLILGLAALMALTFVACDENDDPTLVTVDFEDVALNAAGLQLNDSVSGSISSGDLSVSCTWTTSSYEWDGVTYSSTTGGGFSISNNSDVTTPGYPSNMYSCFAGSGANGSEKFATAYGTSDSVKFNVPVDLESVMLCNNSYTGLSLTNGDAFARAFTSDSSDYFMLTLNMFDASDSKLGSEDFYLADFRDGKSIIVNEWTKLDLSTYKAVSYIKFELESTDVSLWGFNTPAYFCIDNIAYYTTE